MVQSELAHMERAEGHYEVALQTYRETIVVWQRLGHRAAIAHQLECLAFIAKVHEKAERAATLFGAAEALREQIEIQMTVMERVEYEREVADLRAEMDEQVFASAWANGRAKTMEEAISCALEER
jgi:non-specific serine/threonine protein kinase